MADGNKTLGCALHMSTEVGSPQSFVQIGNFHDFSGPSGSRNILNTSHLGTTGGATKLAGLFDEGEFSFNINYDGPLTSHQALETARSDGGLREFKVILTDSGAAEIHFNAIVKSFVFNGPFDDVQTASLTLEISGSRWLSY